jgi:hypothetical protein
MDWLKPLEGKTWLTASGAALSRNEKIARARELSKTHTRVQVAEILGVALSTITLWIGPKRKR